jgi:hypothetical protein
MARAIEWAIERSVNSGGPHLVVNAGSDDWNYQVRDLAEEVASAIPSTQVSINHDAPPDKRSYRVDFSLFRRLAPNHVPVVTLQQTIAELRDGLRAMRFDDTEFRSSQFMRLRALADLRSRRLLTERLEWSDRPALREAVPALEPAMQAQGALASASG